MISQKVRDNIIATLIIALIGAMFSTYLDVQFLKWRDRYFHGEVAK